MTRLELAPVGRELLDDPAADPAAVRESLRNIARSNRWFGGRSAVRHALSGLCAGIPRGSRLTLLDLGTGLGDLPLDANRWAARRGLELLPIGVERSRAAADLARRAGVGMIVGCIGALPLKPRSVDIVLMSQVAHHLSSAAVVGMVRDADAIARLGVVLADLRRATTAQLGFWLGSRLLRFDPATRADGLTSIRRGYTRDELGALLARAGISAQIERRPGFRLVATWRTGGAE